MENQKRLSDNEKTISTVVQFPVDAQCDGLICAFSSLVMAVNKVDDNTPFYCGQKQSVCVNCGNCSDKPIMHKHHNAVYHDFITWSGIGLLWNDTDSAGCYEELYAKDKFSYALPDRLDFIFKAAGYNYLRLTKKDSKEKVFEQIKTSINNEQPVLMKLGNGEDWSVITGYDTENLTLYGIDAHKHWAFKVAIIPDGYTEDGQFFTDKWHENLHCAIIITDKTDELSFSDIVNRMILALDCKEHSELEIKIGAELDDKNNDKEKLGIWLNDLAGYAVERRWHAAECTTAKMYHQTDSKKNKQLLCEITHKYLQFHDLCWKIWGLLGSCPETSYTVASDVAERLIKQEVIDELKALFAKLFEIDRNVLSKLRHLFTIRAIEKNDVKKIKEIALFKENDITDHTWPTNDESILGVTEYFSSNNNSMLVVSADDKEVFGFLSFNNINDQKELALGYIFLDKTENIAVDVLTEIVDYAFKNMDITAVRSNNSIADSQVLKKLNFKVADEFKASFRNDNDGNPIMFDGLTMKMSKEDWIGVT